MGTRARVVWLNGSFGAGKTTVGALIAQSLGGIVVDPEPIGSYLKSTMPRDLVTSDWQDMPVWRAVTRDVVTHVAAHASRPVVVPMTLVVPGYFDEVVGALRRDGVGVRHFTLQVSPATATRRLSMRGDSTPWSFAQVDRCVAGLTDPRFAEHIDADERDPPAIAADICQRLTGAPWSVTFPIRCY